MLHAKNFQVHLLPIISPLTIIMLHNKLHFYITTTLLANILIAAGSLSPTYAKSGETIKNDTKVESTQFNQGEVNSCPFTSDSQDLTNATNADISQQALTEYFNSRPNGNEIEVSSSSEVDLDSILGNEFDQEGILLISRCCL